MNNIIVNHTEYSGMYKKLPTEYDYIEIGTCDWDVMSMTKPTLKGIIVEPIKRYLNNIPNNPNVIKVNCAISVEDSQGEMYYIPPEKIESENIVNCFRGMNKLNEPHMGATSNNLTHHCIKESCEVLTYFELLKRCNVTYVDFLKIDTEGHDCMIINNILDNIDCNQWYILPQYIYFENNGLTPMQTRIETIYRLEKAGYVHIYTEEDNTFMYNCTSYYLSVLKDNGIQLPRDTKLNNNDVNFFQDVHSYLTFGQVDLFKNILNLKMSTDVSDSKNIWTTQELTDHERYSKEGNKNIINIIHGGGFTHSKLLEKEKLNIVVKSVSDYKYIINKTHNSSLFIGKYNCQRNLMMNIFIHRQHHIRELSSHFLMLNGFFNYNPDAVKKTFNELKDLFGLDMFGYDSELGWADIFNNENIENNVLSKYKFMLHLKGNGYLCNSVICAFMVGMPVIMSRDVYYKTLYSQFIPEELIILIDNNDITRISSSVVIPALRYASNMSQEDYARLSKKVFIHGTFFREYYNFELEHLYYFMNNLK